MTTDMYWLGCELRGVNCISKYHHVLKSLIDSFQSFQVCNIYLVNIVYINCDKRPASNLSILRAHNMFRNCKQNTLLKFHFIYFFTSKLGCIPIIIMITHRSNTHTMFWMSKYTWARMDVVWCRVVSCREVYVFISYFGSLDFKDLWTSLTLFRPLMIVDAKLLGIFWTISFVLQQWLVDVVMH